MISNLLPSDSCVGGAGVMERGTERCEWLGINLGFAGLPLVRLDEGLEAGELDGLRQLGVGVEARQNQPKEARVEVLLARLRP